jgi:RNA polymerase sigma-B factor
MVGEIKRYFRDHAWMVKVPRSLQELSNDIHKAREGLRKKLQRPPTSTEISQELNVSEEAVLEGLDVTHAYFPASLEERRDPSDPDSGTLQDTLGVDDFDLKQLLLRKDVSDALHRLPQRERLIIELRFFMDLSQRQVAERLANSQMHISRLERQALAKLKRFLEERAA